MENIKAIAQEMIRVHRDLLGAFERDCMEPLATAAQRLIDVIEGGGTIYLCGNGGSAADAQHVAGELVGRFRRERRALPAVALTTDTSVLTALGNDYDSEHLFSRQVEALVRKGDCLWAFSTSGASKNIPPPPGSQDKDASCWPSPAAPHSLEAMADITIRLDGPTSSVQEIHQLAYHILCGLIETRFAEGKLSFRA